MAQLSPALERIPPQALDAEQAVLGCMMLDDTRAAVETVRELLSPDDFYRDAHRLIYEAICNLDDTDEPADVLTVAQELERLGALDRAGGRVYLLACVDQVPAVSRAQSYAQRVQNASILRRLIEAGGQIIGMAYEQADPVDEIVDDSERLIFSVGQRRTQQYFFELKQLLFDAYEQAERAHETKQRITGIASGFTDLDNMTAGLQPGDFIIVAGRPSMGKCVTGDTRILDPCTGALHTIRSMVEREEGRLVTLDEQWRFQEAAPSCFVDDGLKPTFRVRTALGRVIEATAAHPFLTVAGWKPLGELQAGARIAAPRCLPYFGSLRWPEHQVTALAYFLADGCLTKPTPGFTNANPRILAEFERCMAGFGSVRVRLDDSGGSRTPSLMASVDREAFRTARGAWSARFGAYATPCPAAVRQAARAVGISSSNVNHWLNAASQPSAETWSRLRPLLPDCPEPEQFRNDNPVTAFLREQGLLGKNAHEKHVPPAVFTLDRDCLALFLNRLFACDGSACVSKVGGRDFPVIAYSSVSERLIQDVQHLLLRFGIVAKVRGRRVKYAGTRRRAYELEIHGREDLLRFADEIGIFGKEEALEGVAACTRSHRAGWTKDTLPIELWERILAAKGERSWRSVYEALGLPATTNLHANRRAPRRETALKLARALGDAELERMAQSDVYWDRIVEITPLGLQQVYDLTIPGTHNFVANDLVVHNTAMVLNVAVEAAAASQKPVAIFSLEMSRIQLTYRLICSEAKVDSSRLRSGYLQSARDDGEDDWTRLGRAIGRLGELPIYIDDSSEVTALEMRAKCRRLKAEHGLGLVIVDYLQLIRGHGRSENRNQEISVIARALKSLARELQVPVIALSQLSRNVERRDDKRPLLSDLRESGSIEAEADLVMMLYRSQYYKHEEAPAEPRPYDDALGEVAEVIIAKHRNGPTGIIRLSFLRRFACFENLAEDYRVDDEI